MKWMKEAIAKEIQEAKKPGFARWIQFMALAFVLAIIGFSSLFYAKSVTIGSLITPGTILRYETLQTKEGDLYCPVVDYQFQGYHQSFQERACTRKPIYQQGEVVDVYYDPAKPAEAKIRRDEGLYFWPWFFLSFALMVFAIALVDRYLQIQKSFVGMTVQAKVVNISCFNNQGKRRSKLCFIEAVWINPETEEVLEFRSQGLPFDPTPLYQGKDIEVIFDPRNPKKYKFKFDSFSKKSA